MGLDLTGARWLKRTVRSPFFPALLQWATLGVFGYLILAGWRHHGIRGIEAPDPLVYTNIATLFFWVIWLMGLIVLAPLVGRLWCTVCPLGYLNDMLARFGLRRRYPQRLRNLYLPALLLVVFNGLVAYLVINHYPDYSARLLLGVTLAVVATALLFRGRVFCGYLCPIGAMVGLYSRVSPWRLDVRDREVCRSCESKACYLGEKKRFRLKTPLGQVSFPFNRPGCQVDLFPPELVEDPRCVMCTQCIKNCPHDNIRWGSRPFLRGVVTPSVPDTSEAVFLLVLAGAVLSTLSRVWPALNMTLAAPATRLVSALDLGGTLGGEILQLAWGFGGITVLGAVVLSGLVVFLATSRLEELPGVPPGGEGTTFSFGLPERAERLAGSLEGWDRRKKTLPGVLGTFTLSMTPLILAAHAAFALVKINEKILYLPAVLRDPSGVKLYLAIHRLGIMAVPRALLPLPVVRWVALALVAAGAVASLWAATRLASRVYAAEPSFRRWGGGVFAAANAGLGVLFCTMVVKWLF